MPDPAWVTPRADPASSLAQSGGLGTTGPSRVYTTAAADLAAGDQWNSDTYNVFIEWTPTLSATIDLARFGDLPDGIDYAYWQLFKGNVPNVDYPGRTGSAAWNSARAGIGFQGHSRAVVEAGQVYTAVVAIGPSAPADGIDVPLDVVYQSLQVAGGIDPLSPWPDNGPVRLVDGALGAAPALPQELLLNLAVTIHGNGPNGDRPASLPLISIYKGPDPGRGSSGSQQTISYPMVIPPGGYVGPKWTPTNWSEAFEAHLPTFAVVEFQVIAADGSAGVTLEADQAADLSITNDQSNGYNFDFLDWASPQYSHGSDLTLASADPWRVYSAAGGVFIVAMMVDAYFAG